ncbi:TetR/AcrR family transcriptional regulator [Nocardioides sp. SYSU DS0663]|uniref:TetR/AcrR family transcriptional regulator n=1 Tax=Nocardioides sp. SYSU DS0663 TaxID=3416445 RepID=UPI003F4C169D
MTVPPTARTARAERTRAAIAEAAMRLFHRDGYDGATMRAIAEEAGVSLGNAYYYFDSKQHLVQAFYDAVQVAHAAAVDEALASERGFAGRLRVVLDAWPEVARPHHALATQFFRHAADPRSPLSPFSPESAPARAASTAIFERVVTGSDLRLAPGLRRELPELLWLLHMGLVLHWVHDASPDQERSRLLAERVVPVVDRLVRLSRLPVVRGVVDDVVDLLAALRQG